MILPVCPVGKVLALLAFLRDGSRGNEESLFVVVFVFAPRYNRFDRNCDYTA
jgi:hypothetical protein